MKPSIGRIVHYRVTPNHVLPAIIVSVHGESLANLAVLTDGHNTYEALEAAAGREEPIGIEFPNPQSGVDVWDLGGPAFRVTSRAQGDEVGEWFWPTRV